MSRSFIIWRIWKRREESFRLAEKLRKVGRRKKDYMVIIDYGEDYLYRDTFLNVSLEPTVEEGENYWEVIVEETGERFRFKEIKRMIFQKDNKIKVYIELE